MAIAKLILNNATQMDLTADTVTTSDHIMEGYVGHLRNGTSVTGTGKIAASEQAALDALVRYSNEITGESDTTISEAVETLVDGYGRYTIEDIAEGAIRNIEEVTIKSVTLETRTFSDSTFKIIHLPNAVTLNGRPFNGSAVELIDIPNVENLGDAFYACNKLSGSYGEETGVLRLPKVVTANTYAFYNTKVQKVYFMATASNLRQNIFYNCSNLTDIYVPWSEGAVNNAPWSNNSNVVVHYNTVYDSNGEPIA